MEFYGEDNRISIDSQFLKFGAIEEFVASMG